MEYSGVSVFEHSVERTKPIYLKLQNRCSGVNLLIVDEDGEQVDSGHLFRFYISGGKLACSRIMGVNTSLCHVETDQERLRVKDIG